MPLASPSIADRVSVVVPAYNAERYLRQTLLSIVEQSARPKQVIVVDDGSSDGTAAAARGFGDLVEYQRQENAGVSAARNRGLQLARGEWVMFVDADDLLPADSLELLLAAAGSRRRCVVYGRHEIIDEAGASLGKRRPKRCTGDPPAAARASFDESPFPPGTAIVATALAREAGGFDERFSTCADRHFWVRCGCLAPFYECPRTVYRYRLHGESMSRDRVANACEGTLVQIDCLQWTRARGIDVWPPGTTPLSLVENRVWRLLWSRRWNSFDALLELAAELGLESSSLRAAERVGSSASRQAPAVYADDPALQILSGLAIVDDLARRRGEVHLEGDEQQSLDEQIQRYAARSCERASRQGLRTYWQVCAKLRKAGLGGGAFAWRPLLRALRHPRRRAGSLTRGFASLRPAEHAGEPPVRVVDQDES